MAVSCPTVRYEKALGTGLCVVVASGAMTLAPNMPHQSVFFSKSTKGPSMSTDVTLCHLCRPPSKHTLA